MIYDYIYFYWHRITSALIVHFMLTAVCFVGVTKMQMSCVRNALCPLQVIKMRTQARSKSAFLKRLVWFGLHLNIYTQLYQKK